MTNDDIIPQLEKYKPGFKIHPAVMVASKASKIMEKEISFQYGNR